ncbi:transcription factor TFIIIB component B'' homolog [Uranotaenia lowii]|uniref:transcription factor TFIIIB component B'' homolog n=1 Tax=Uranotaenia lowii TaxID=190385 RepID=UPI002479EC32|nr:transcription factor TFIIIB component B'' homolog [Uranotaenia lowii]
MAMRRPRIKPTLAIRRPVKDSSAVAASVNVKPVVSAATAATSEITANSNTDVPSLEGKSTNENVRERKVSLREESVSSPAVEPVPEGRSKENSVSSPEDQKSAFKFPNPVAEPPRIVIPPPTVGESASGDEIQSPKKMDGKFNYINALNSPRKRIRTESMTSNKSYSDVSLKSRKSIKQEETEKAKREHRKRLKYQNMDRQTFTMFDMIYYDPAKNPMKNPAPSKKGSMENAWQASGSGGRISRDVSKSRSPTPAPAMPPPPEPAPKAPVQLTPQLKLGPNGEMILDEASLVVENEREKEIRDALARTEVVYQDEFSGNSGYYSRYKRTKDWPPEETIRFYRCLHTIGTDFSMMNQLFPNRTRRDLKLKFKKEERLNMRLVNKALLYPKQFNIEELQEQFQQEDEEIERRKEMERQMKLENEKKMREQKITKKLLLGETKNRNPTKRVSKSERVMLDAENLMKNTPVAKEVKPKRRRKRKTNNNEGEDMLPETTPQQQTVTPANQGVQDPPALVPKSQEQQDDVFDEPGDQNSSSVECLGPNQSIATTISDATFIPNDEPSTPIAGSQSLRESELDIETMDIHIVDNSSRSIYEIKAEPQAYSAQPYGHPITTGPEQNYITLQNFDNRNQNVVAYPMESDDYLKSLEDRFYGTCDVYIPTPSNAPVAHPVKTHENYSSSTPLNDSFVSLQSTVEQSYPVTYILPHAKPDVQDISPVVITVPEQLRQVNESDALQETMVDRTSENYPSEQQLLVSKPEPYSYENQQQVVCNPEEPQQHIETKGEILKKEETEPEEQVPEETVTESSDLAALENIDLNSLVLVESQDTNDPSRTIYEIYVTDPETGKLSEKPLDVPEDVIDNIRSILEGGGEADDEDDE